MVEGLRPALIKFANYQFPSQHERPVPGDPHIVAIDEDKTNKYLGYALWPLATNLHESHAERYAFLRERAAQGHPVGELVEVVAYMNFEERVNLFNR